MEYLQETITQTLVTITVQTPVDKSCFCTRLTGIPLIYLYAVYITEFLKNTNVFVEPGILPLQLSGIECFHRIQDDIGLRTRPLTVH